jgi:hypothetical protein
LIFYWFAHTERFSLATVKSSQLRALVSRTTVARVFNPCERRWITEMRDYPRDFAEFENPWHKKRSA